MSSEKYITFTRHSKSNTDTDTIMSTVTTTTQSQSSPQPSHTIKLSTSTGYAVRLASRNEYLTAPTSGLAATYIQANLLILPSKYATDFKNLCLRNPVPCPLIASSQPGSLTFISHVPHLSTLFNHDIDIRTDIPRYNVYSGGKLLHQGLKDVKDFWTDDSVAFLIGCSFSFEAELSAAGLPPRHVTMNRNASMYETNIPLCPAGVFSGRYVVSMRPYKRRDIENVRAITRKYAMTHGEPIDWGWDAVERLGIKDFEKPDWGDVCLNEDDSQFRRKETGGRDDGMTSEDDDEYIPIFWGCGVTPQQAVMTAGKQLGGMVIGHMPGHMLALDIRDEDLLV